MRPGLPRADPATHDEWTSRWGWQEGAHHGHGCHKPGLRRAPRAALRLPRVDHPRRGPRARRSAGGVRSSATRGQHQRAPREMRAWLFRVGRNLVIDRGRRQQLADRLQDRLRVGSAGPSAEDECLVREARRELDVLLAQTSSDDRTALLMAAAGYSGAEIARAVGLSEGAVRTRMTRARGRLRMRLRPVS